MSELNHLNPLERKLYLALKDAREWIGDSRSDDWISSTAALAAAETVPEAPYYPEKGDRYQTLVWGDIIEANATREDYERESAARTAIGKAPFKYRPAKEGGV